MNLNIPPVPENLLCPVRALSRAAYLFRGVLLAMMQGTALDDVLATREEALRLADHVVNRWADYFGEGADPEAHAGDGEAG